MTSNFLAPCSKIYIGCWLLANMPVFEVQEGKHTRSGPQPLGALCGLTNPSTTCSWDISNYGDGKLEVSKSGLVTGWGELVESSSGPSNDEDEDVWAVGLRLVRSG